MAWQLPLNVAVFHWASLWEALRRRVPDARYHQGSPVIGALDRPSGRVSLTLENGSVADADLGRHDHLEPALDEWGASQVALGDRLLALGEQMEQAFIWNPLDLTDADATTTEAWWRKAVAFPEGFTHESTNEAS